MTMLYCSLIKGCINIWLLSHRKKILSHDYMHRQTVKNKVRLDKCADSLQSCQPRVTVTSSFVYKFIMDLSSIDH